MEPGGSTSDQGMTLPEAAAALGVHYMTAYRYVRTGRLPAVRAGVHWEIDPSDVARLSQARRCRAAGAGSRGGRSAGAHQVCGEALGDLGAADAVPGSERPGGGRPGERRSVGKSSGIRGSDAHMVVGEPSASSARDLPSLGAGLQRRLLCGDEAAVWGIVQDLMAWGTEPEGIVVDVLAPAMVAIGDQWATGAISVGKEHRASQVAARVLSRLGPSFSRRGRRRGTVVMGAAAGDRHGLAVSMAVNVARGAGWEVVDLGPDVPAAAFAEAAAGADRLAAVAVGSTVPGAVDAIRDVVAAVETVGSVPVVVGGAGVPSASLAAAMGATAWSGGDARQLIAVLGALVRGGTSSKA